MDAVLCITIRFLQPSSHGRGEQGEPEWPPSPLRVFQSLIAAAAARWNERVRIGYAVPALQWLERRSPPLIVAGRGEPSQSKYRLYVPDNVGDKVAGSWSRGGAASIADYRTEKDVRPTHLPASDAAVHYLWPIADPDPEFEKHKEVLFAAARSITHLGWGVDMVAANASAISSAEADQIPGERWRPADDGSAKGYRVPVEGTLAALIDKHEAFLNRIGPDSSFRPVPPLSTFKVVGYRRAMDPPNNSVAVFSLLKTDASGYRPFDTVRHVLRVAGMMRHATGSEQTAQALGWPPEKVAQFVLGHGEAPGESHAPVSGPRLAFIPLPSIERRGDGPPQVVTSIRRAMIAVLGGSADDDLQRLARVLSGSDLIREEDGEHLAMLSRIPETDSVVRLYCQPAETWATVTPVILPGYDDPRKLRKRLSLGFESASQAREPVEQKAILTTLERRIEFLLRKAIEQAGYSRELARHAAIEWRTVGFWPGTDLATRYPFPNKSRRYRRLHVRITWRDPNGRNITLPGPICLGGGRYHGIGLFAGMSIR
jgi:CRISPR-associated protein Csb2